MHPQIRLLLAAAALPVAMISGDARAQNSEPAFRARLFTPAGTLTTPSLASIAGDVAGPGFHAQMSVGGEAPLTAVYGVSSDFRMPRGRIRFGATAAMAEGHCTRDAVYFTTCVAGYLFGVNAIGAIIPGRAPSRSGEPVFSLGWSADAGTSTTGHNVSLGAGVPLMVSFESVAQRTAADLPHNPKTTLFFEPGVSLGMITEGKGGQGVLPQLSLGASLLQIGPGFGVTALVRKFSGSHDLSGAASVSFHPRHRR